MHYQYPRSIDQIAPLVFIDATRAVKIYNSITGDVCARFCERVRVFFSRYATDHGWDAAIDVPVAGGSGRGILLILTSANGSTASRLSKLMDN